MSNSFEGRFIPGLCRVWAKTPQWPYWRAMTYPARGWHDCVAIAENYQERFGSLYSYEVTADSDLCRPRG